MANVIAVHVREAKDRWFGVAYVGEEIVATTIASTRQTALRNLVKSLPVGAKHALIDEESEFAAKTIHMLRELESGNEENKRYSQASGYVPQPLANVLRTAAAVPVGYVTSYGDVARASRTIARVVGRIMAANPLYPIVACHRVVGSDLSLVGYGGRKDPAALQAKLSRLARETRGYSETRDVPVGDGTLKVYPVEWVIERVEKKAREAHRQRTLFD